MEGKSMSEKGSKKERLEKSLIVLMLIALWTLAITNSYIPEAAAGEVKEAGSAYGEENEYPGIIRFHVIANSDSEQDQELKLAVRDYVLPKIEAQAFATAASQDGGSTEASFGSSVENMRAYISANLEQIRLWAEEYVRSQGFDYEIKTQLGVRAIPARSYDELYFPAGNYEALTITIGEGEGRNWWCVVFPPLCLIDSSGKEHKETVFSDEEGQNRIVLKSKLRELLRKSV